MHCLIIAFIGNVLSHKIIIFHLNIFFVHSPARNKFPISSSFVWRRREFSPTFYFYKKKIFSWDELVQIKIFTREMEKLRSRSFSSSSLMCSSFHSLRIHLLWKKKSIFSIYIEIFFSKWTPNGQFFSVTTPVYAPTPGYASFSLSLSDFINLCGSLALRRFQSIKKPRSDSVSME